MLVIRNEQVQALADTRRARFEATLVDHHLRMFPAWSAALGTGRLQSFVRHGIESAQRHGFVAELDIARYLHVMQNLGERFDEAPEHAWAAQLLSRNLPAAEKLNRLRDAVDYLREATRIRIATEP